MLALRAVVPERLLRTDLHGHDGQHHIGLADRHVPGVESRHVGHGLADGLARVVEGGLNDGMVHWVEVPLYHFPDGDGLAGGTVG